MTSQDIEKEVYRKFPKTDGERHCSFEREAMREVRNAYRLKLQSGLTPGECEFDIEKLRSEKK